MSIERLFDDYDGDITIVCDECGDSFDAGTSDFYGALADYKRSGGTATRVAGEWMHTCPDCARSEAEDDFERFV